MADSHGSGDTAVAEVPFDILEDEDDEGAQPAGGSLDIQSDGNNQTAEAAAPEAGLDAAADVRATLGSVATGLAEQLSSITEEMNKIRQELYGDSGIGGIAKELEKLKAGGLGGLLDTDALDDLRSAAGETTSGRSSAPRSSTSSSASGSFPRGSAAAESDALRQGSEVRRRRAPGERSPEREAELEALRRKLMERHPKEKKASISFWEKLVLLFLVLICLYIGSPFFRTAVKRAFTSVVLGKSADGEDEEEFFEFDS